MKRIILLIMLLCMMLPAGCAAGTQTAGTGMPVWEAIPEPAPAVAGASKPKIDQEKIIIENQAGWRPTQDHASDYMAFCITDLDGNGRSEVISSQQGGAGNYSYSRIFEVNEEMDGLTEVGAALAGMSSQPDLIDDRWECYYDAPSGTYYYIVCDLKKDGPAGNSRTLSALSLKDGAVTLTPLARKTQIYNSRDGLVTRCENAQGEMITEEEYLHIGDQAFPGTEKKTIILHWTRMQ